MIPLQMLLAALLGWLDREQRDVIAFFREENRVLKAQLGSRRLRLDDDQRRRLALLGQRLGRGLLREFATLVTPDTILRWHRELVARKWTYARRSPGRPGVRQDIRRLVVRMVTDNPQWGYTRIQGSLKNVGHRVARSTIASILKAEGLPTTWRAADGLEARSCERTGRPSWQPTSSPRKSGGCGGTGDQRDRLLVAVGAVTAPKAMAHCNGRLWTITGLIKVGR